MRCHVTNQFTCLLCACKTWIYFLLDYFIFVQLWCFSVFSIFILSIITTWWLFWLLLCQEGLTLAEHLAIPSRVSSTTPTLCGNLLSPPFSVIAGHLWLLSIADSIEHAIMSSANDLTSLAAEGTATRDTHCPNETVATDAKSSKATSRTFQDGGGPSKKRSSSGSHTKPWVSCSLTHRHQTQTRSHPHTSTDQSTSTSSDVPAIFNQFADLMLQMQKRQLETLTSLFPDTSARANDTDEDSGVSPAKIGRKDSASTSITTPAELSGPAVDPQQPAESLDDLEALVTGDDHASAPPIEEDCALDTEISELERFFQISDSSGATIDEKFLPAINAGLLSTIDHEKIQSVLTDTPVQRTSLTFGCLCWINRSGTFFQLQPDCRMWNWNIFSCLRPNSSRRRHVAFISSAVPRDLVPR